MTDFTDMGGAVLTASSPLSLGPPVTNFRFYAGLRSPEQGDFRVTTLTGVGTGGGWQPVGQPSSPPQPFQQIIDGRLLARTKVDNGFLTFTNAAASFLAATISDPYTSFQRRWVTEPCGAFTASGTLTITVAQRGLTQGTVALVAAAFVMSADGRTNKGALGSVEGSFAALTADELFRTVVITLASVAVAAGDRIAVEVGATFVKATPTAFDESVRMYFGSQLTWGGAPVADGVDGDLDGNLKAGHFTFSTGVPITPTQWTGGNDECIAATSLGASLPIVFGPLDTTKSPGVDPTPFADSAGIQNSAWFSFTSPVTGRLVISTLGSNYFVHIRLFLACGGSAQLTSTRAPRDGLSQSAVVFEATAGVTYLVKFATNGRALDSTQFLDTAIGSGGSLRFAIFAQIQAPATDDLYLGGEHIFVYRKLGGVWTKIMYNNGLTYGLIPTGMAFDYARTGVIDINDSLANTTDDFLVSSLFFFELLEYYNARTLNAPVATVNETNFQCLSGTSALGPGAAFPSGARGSDMKIIPQAGAEGQRVQGEAIVGTEGDNYDFYGGLSSSNGAAFRRVRLTPDWFCGSAPFRTIILDDFPVALENQATDHFDIYPDLDTILYTSAGLRLLSYQMSTKTQLTDFVSVPTSNSARPGARGVRLLPDLSVIVAIGGQLHHYSPTGVFIKTMVSTNPARHQSLERIALTNDGNTAMVIDIVHSDVLEFDLLTGAHVATIETNFPVGSTCGIAVYRGFESPPPPPPPPENLGGPPAAGTGTTFPIRRQRAAPHINEEQAWIYYSRFQLDFEEGVGLDVGLTTLGHDPQIMMDFSDDGGFTWSTETWRSAGRSGERLTRALWRRLGRSRDRIYRITVSDPVKWAFVDAYVNAQGGTS